MDTLSHAHDSSVQSDTDSTPDTGKGWLLPAVGAIILTALWLAYLIPDAIGILSAVAR